MAARVAYSIGVSLDGYVEDERGNFDWAKPPEDVHRLANERAREASAFLFGRRLYELMEAHWPAAATRDDLPEIEAGFARAYVETPRIVFSDSLESVGDGARLVRSPEARAEVERLKREGDGYFDIGGPTLAGTLVDLIDDFHMWVAPVAVGGGKRYWPAQPGTLHLRLVENRTCSNGFVYLRYERAASPSEAPA
jgi:dihydrofolate reductase